MSDNNRPEPAAVDAKTPDTGEILPLPKAKGGLKRFLQNRRSNLAKLMGEPGPAPEQITDMLTIAARVPDHRKLAPWRFTVFEGPARDDFGQHIASAFMKVNPDAPHDRAIFEGQRFMRAPLEVAVISSPIDCPRGTPQWEQILSAGAACYNLCLAAQSMGFGAQWLTEWYAYDPDVMAALDVETPEKIAGFIYIGTPSANPTERSRPDIIGMTKFWGI